MWVYPTRDLSHSARGKRGWVRVFIMKDALEKGVKEAIFPRRPAESLERSTSMLSRTTVNWS